MRDILYTVKIATTDGAEFVTKIAASDYGALGAYIRAQYPEVQTWHVMLISGKRPTTRTPFRRD